MDLSFIILTFNSAQDIALCLNSYMHSLNRDMLTAEFLIADNGSNDATISIIENEIPSGLKDGFSIEIIKLNKNRGTTEPRNLLISKAKAPLIVICDADTQFCCGDWKCFIQFLVDHNDVGIVAPYICDSKGINQVSVKKFPLVSDKLGKLGKIFFGMSSETTDHYSAFPWREPTPVDTAISAFWFLNKETIKQVGGFDEKIFYSPEDLDFCLRVWGKKKKVIFYPNFKIIHRTQQISHKRPFSKQAITHFAGLFYYFLKHSYGFSRSNLYRRLGIREN